MKIDKNIPIPTEKRRSKYPWIEMEVGDSFLVARELKASIRSLVSVKNTAGKEKFTYRTTQDGIRVWRIE
jgi:hypothetical protein